MKSLKNRLYSFLKSQNAILLLCLGIAFVFWFITKMSNDNFSIKITVPLSYNLPKNSIVTTELDSTLSVRLNSNGWECINTLYIKDNGVITIHTDSIIGSKRISYNQLINRVSNHLKIESSKIKDVIPSSLDLLVERKFTKKVAVKISPEFNAPNNTIILKSSFIPDSIEIYGAQEVISPISDYYISPVIDKTSGIIQSNILIDQDHSIKSNAKNIEAEFEVDQITEKEVLVPVEISLPDGYSFEPKKILFTCSTTLKDFDLVGVNSISISIPIDSTEIIKKDSLTINVNKYVSTEHIISYKNRFSSIKIIKKDD